MTSEAVLFPICRDFSQESSGLNMFLKHRREHMKTSSMANQMFILCFCSSGWLFWIYFCKPSKKSFSPRSQSHRATVDKPAMAQLPPDMMPPGMPIASGGACGTCSTVTMLTAYASAVLHVWPGLVWSGGMLVSVGLMKGNRFVNCGSGLTSLLWVMLNWVRKCLKPRPHPDMLVCLLQN